jgi:beta-glucanase (GH16 family)
MDHPATSRVRVVLSALILLAGGLAGTAVAVATAAPALAGTVPPAPPGWTTVFGDDFDGAAGSGPSMANWFYDIGTDSGNQEVNSNTNSTSNVYLDGNGHLVIKAINNGGSWTAGKIESTRDDFQAPPGGELEMTASLEQPNPANGLGYWPAFWALGAPTRAGGSQATSGETDMMEDVNGLNKAAQFLHTAAGTSSSHQLIPCPASGSGCQTGYHTYSVIINRTNTSAESLQFLMDGTVESTVTEAHVGATTWQEAIDHGFFIILNLAIGGHYPNGICGCTTPTSATTSGASMSVSYVAVYEKGGNSTPTATPTATGELKGIDGLCMANRDSVNTELNPMVLRPCNGSTGEQWTGYTDGTLRTNGGCLDVVSGTTVGWYPCSGLASETWDYKSGELVNPHTNMCLTDPGGNTTAWLDIATCTRSTAQVWALASYR